MTLDDVTRGLSIVGGITGPLGLIITYLTYRRDAGRLRVHLIRKQRMRSPNDDSVRILLEEYRENGAHPPMELFIRDPDKTWAVIEVVNIGRRKVRLEKIGWKVINDKYVFPGGYFGYPGSTAWLPCDLEEGEARDFPIEDSHIADAGYVFARTSTGRWYYGGFASGWRGFWYRVMTWLSTLRGR